MFVQFLVAQFFLHVIIYILYSVSLLLEKESLDFFQVLNDFMLYNIIKGDIWHIYAFIEQSSLYNICQLYFRYFHNSFWPYYLF